MKGKLTEAEYNVKADALRAAAHNSALAFPLYDRLAGIGRGRIVNVVGSGPSGANLKAKPGEITIACNGAIKNVKADVWVCGEAESWHKEWFLGNEDFKGFVCLERFNTAEAGARALLENYSDAWLSRVLWFHRVQWHKDDDPAKFRKGLWCVRSEVLGDEAGTTALHAIHIAMMMQAAEIRLYGVELHFPEGKQYAVGENVYTEGDKLSSLTGFDLTPDGEPFIMPTGRFTSTPVFIESARVIRRVLANYPDLKIKDYSGGLLNPAGMLNAEGMERAKDSGSDTEGK